MGAEKLQTSLLNALHKTILIKSNEAEKNDKKGNADFKEKEQR